MSELLVTVGQVHRDASGGEQRGAAFETRGGCLVQALIEQRATFLEERISLSFAALNHGLSLRSHGAEEAERNDHGAGPTCPHPWKAKHARDANRRALPCGGRAIPRYVASILHLALRQFPSPASGRAATCQRKSV